MLEPELAQTTPNPPSPRPGEGPHGGKRAHHGAVKSMICKCMCKGRWLRERARWRNGPSEITCRRVTTEKVVRKLVVGGSFGLAPVLTL